MVNWKNIHLNWRKFCLKVRWILLPKQRVGKRPHVSDVKVILKIWVPSMTSRKTSWEQLLEMDKEAYEYHYPSLYYNRKTLSTEKPGGHRVGWLSLSGVTLGGYSGFSFQVFDIQHSVGLLTEVLPTGWLPLLVADCASLKPYSLDVLWFQKLELVIGSFVCFIFIRSTNHKWKRIGEPAL